MKLYFPLMCLLTGISTGILIVKLQSNSYATQEKAQVIDSPKYEARGIPVLPAPSGFKGWRHNEPEYKIFRDTVLIDLSRQKNLSLHEYQLEVTVDSIYVYEGQRLVKVIGSRESINEVIINDNL